LTETALQLARRLIRVKDGIWMRAVSMRTGEDGRTGIADPDLPIDWKAASAAQEDKGAYLLIVEMKRACTVRAGSLGEVFLQRGWYVYVGSGMKNLSAKIARHHRSNKRLHWHIDYLLEHVDPGDLTSLPIRSRHRLECRLARAVAEIAAGSAARFGCSDCACPSHLFRFTSDPLRDRRFLDLLLHYRHTVALARCGELP
jgi:sugar fermentation stimulation protein A